MPILSRRELLNAAAASPFLRVLGRQPRRFQWSRRADQSRQGFYAAPAGLCDDYPEASRTKEKLRRDLNAVRDTGARVLRFGIAWDTTERSPGEFDWRFWDMMVEQAPRNGVTLIPYLCYTPQWASDAQSDAYRKPPRDPALFGRFAQTIAARYRGRVASWEIWNEEDNKDFWLGSVEQYRDLLRAGVSAVRKGDPGATVVLGGLAGGSDSFFSALRSEVSLAEMVDAVNFHGYAETWNAMTVENYSGYIEAMRQACSGGGKQAPDLWLAEFGYSSNRSRNSAAVPWAAHNLFTYEHTPEYQAQMLLKAHIVAISTGKLSLTAWYRINDLPADVNVIGDDNNRYLGILDVHGNPKPAYGALKLINRLFAEPLRPITSELRTWVAADPSVAAYEFERPNGGLILAAWLRTPRQESVSSPLPDSGSAAMSFSMPDGRFRWLTRLNLAGAHSETRQPMKPETPYNLDLTGERVTLVELTRR